MCVSNSKVQPRQPVVRTLRNSLSSSLAHLDGKRGYLGLLVPLNVGEVLGDSNDAREDCHEPRDEGNLGVPAEGQPDGVLDGVVDTEVEEETSDESDSCSGGDRVPLASNRRDGVHAPNHPSHHVEFEEDGGEELCDDKGSEEAAGTDRPPRRLGAHFPARDR